MKQLLSHNLALGAELLDAGVHFRVWAPDRDQVEVVLIGTPSRTFRLERDAEGFWQGLIQGVPAGVLYHFKLDGRKELPDPASRFQPEGVHGPSQIIDSARFEWTDADWRGVSIHGQVIYELHVGTFTVEGTWRAAGNT